MTIVITDSTILILCVKINIFDILIDKYGIIYIPSGVYLELVVNGKKAEKEDAFFIEDRINNKLVKVIDIQNTKSRDKLMKDFKIHLGEAECIVLFSEIEAELLGTDDKKTINLCKMLKIPYFSVLSFIMLCISESRISKSRAVLKIRKLERFGWYKSSFLESIIENIQKIEVD
ncbi:MAG: hypothetical protein ACTSRK_14385 [Promethearchaeota archaeon]